MEASSGLLALDLAGVFVFALSGSLAAVSKRLDMVGVTVIGTVAAIGGGLLRDVLLGDVPPPALADWRYVVVASVASVLVFFFHPQVNRFGRAVRLFDAAGLGLFAVAGTAKALDAGLGPVPACLLGVVTGVGGGLLRDLLLGEIPLVLRNGEQYAVTALAGSMVVIAGDRLDVSGPAVTIGAVALVFLLRVAAIRQHWSAPVPRQIEDQ